MAQLLVTGTDARGNRGSVAIEVVKDGDSGSIPLSGDVSGTFGDAHIVADLNLIGDVFVEGLLTGIDTFHLQGNGFTVFFQNGGRADLHGKAKAAWGPWGTNSNGWVAGDRLAIAPTKAGIYVPSELVWSDWSMARPSNSPDVSLFNGSVRKPEVVNLSQSIVFENLARGFHFHDSAGIQNLSDVKFLNCGTAGVTGNYPVHFHLLGENSRGSLLERVVVEGGKNHAFVPHGSHGITMKDCVAFNTIGDVFWWDVPAKVGDALRKFHTANNSNDITWERCFVLGVISIPKQPGRTDVTGFALGAGFGNKCVGCVASGVRQVISGSGFHWPSTANDNVGGNQWEFDDCLAHNNENHGIFVWQNDDSDHLITDYTAFHNGFAGINHGAYVNQYHYLGVTLHGNTGAAVNLHSVATNGFPIIFEDLLTDGLLRISGHSVAGDRTPSYFRRCIFTGVVVDEIKTVNNPSTVVLEDCGLAPADFVFTSVMPQSIFEIWQGGVLLHRWTAGVWS